MTKKKNIIPEVERDMYCIIERDIKLNENLSLLRKKCKFKMKIKDDVICNLSYFVFIFLTSFLFLNDFR